MRLTASKTRLVVSLHVALLGHAAAHNLQLSVLGSTSKCGSQNIELILPDIYGECTHWATYYSVPCYYYLVTLRSTVRSSRSAYYVMYCTS